MEIIIANRAEQIEDDGTERDLVAAGWLASFLFPYLSAEKQLRPRLRRAFAGDKTGQGEWWKSLSRPRPLGGRMPSFKVSTQAGGRGWRAGVWVQLARFCHLGGAAEIGAKASSNIDNNRHCCDSHHGSTSACYGGIPMHAVRGALPLPPRLPARRPLCPQRLAVPADSRQQNVERCLRSRPPTRDLPHRA
jgi:hypothetical protein